MVFLNDLRAIIVDAAAGHLGWALGGAFAFGVAICAAVMTLVFGKDTRAAEREAKLADREAQWERKMREQAETRCAELERHIAQLMATNDQTVQALQATITQQKLMISDVDGKLDTALRCWDEFKASGQRSLVRLGDGSTTIIVFTTRPKIQLDGKLSFPGPQGKEPIDVHFDAYGSRGRVQAA
jgi:hypothetical protein